uniref:Glucose transporter rco-3 n=1 Tax=Ganoderma boninense TaxID=34458 RepID=A0A5K1JRI5_9APHY|nr:Glucose transporter rco-3 [Ganoderma boninense]
MPPTSPSRLVGQPLLYAISVFASLGVFLANAEHPLSSSSGTIKGKQPIASMLRACQDSRLTCCVNASVMSGVITGPHFRKYFNEPGPVEVGTMVAVLEIGAFVTSVAAGQVGDIIGRRGTLFSGAVVFAIGGAIQTFTPGFWVMVFGRIISGLGVGLLSTIVPIYQSEISPPNHRGALACMEFTGNIFGYASSVWIDYFCSFIDSDLAWRIPLFIQCVIGAILAIGSLVMPESPRWLIDVDRDEEGMRVISDLHGGDPEDLLAKAEFQEIKDRVMFERESGEGRTYANMWKRYKRRVLLAMSSQAFAQLNGINVISYYAPRVFEEAGWIGRDAILMTGINSIIYILSTLPPWILVDRWGRRVILLSGAVIMAVSLGFTGWWMYIDVPETPKAVVFCVIIFNAAFGYSWGPIPWLYPPEIMPLTVRAKGVSLSTATNWAFNFLVGWMTPLLQEIIEWRLYPMHGFFCICSFILVYFLYPETKGVPLEEMDAVFGEEELEEQLEDEASERGSLLSQQSSRSRRGHGRNPSKGLELARMNSSAVEGDNPGALPRRPSPVVHSNGSDDDDD